MKTLQLTALLLLVAGSYALGCVYHDVGTSTKVTRSARLNPNKPLANQADEEAIEPGTEKMSPSTASTADIAQESPVESAPME